MQKTAERDSVTRLLAIFLLKDSTWASYEQTKMVPQTFLFLRRYLIAKFDFYFRYVGFHIFKLFILYHPSTFLPDCSLKICEKPSKISESVRLVNDFADTLSAYRVVNNYSDEVSAYSTSMLTSCPLTSWGRSQQLSVLHFCMFIWGQVKLFDK